MNDEITRGYNKVIFWLSLSSLMITLATLFVPIFHVDLGLIKITELGCRFLGYNMEYTTGDPNFWEIMGCDTKFLSENVFWQIVIKIILWLMIISTAVLFALSFNKKLSLVGGAFAKQNIYAGAIGSAFWFNTTYMLISVLLCIIVINEGEFEPATTFTYIPWLLQLGLYIALKALRRHHQRALSGEVEPIGTRTFFNYATYDNNITSKNEENEKVELLIKYKQLLDEGVITKEEYDSKKRDLLQ